MAQAFALQYPAMTRSLILADTVSEVGREARAAVETWLAAARAADAQAFFDATVPWNFSPAFGAAHLKLPGAGHASCWERPAEFSTYAASRL